MWKKAMGQFSGTDPDTGNEFKLIIHWFQEVGGSMVFDVKTIDLSQ
jgi:hypothetical protein